MRIGFLFFKSLKQSRFDLDYSNTNDYWNSKNFGSAILRDALERAGYQTDVCLPDTAKNYDIVLVSLTSHFDVFALGKAVVNLPDWQGDRKFKVIVGGFGCQNPMMLKDWADYAWFGRCENNIADIVKDVDGYEHASYMRLSEPKPVIINQPEKVYPHSVKIDFNYKTEYKESMLGCPNKCFYCHYTYSRKKVGEGKFLYNELDGSSDELEWCDASLYNPLKPHLITAIDAWSERLRFAMNRRISNLQFQEFVREIASKTECSGVGLKLYNVTGYETETDDDYYEFIDTVSQLDGRLIKPVTITIQTTPLTPSPITPIQYAPVRIETDINSKFKNMSRVFEGHNIKVNHSLYLDSNYMHFLSGFAIRYTEQYYDLYRTIINDKSFDRLNNKDKLDYVLSHFNTFDITRAYGIDEQLPTWFLNSYIDERRLKLMRTKMLERLSNTPPLLDATRIGELKDMVEFLNIIGASHKGKTNKQKKLEKYNHYLDNL